MKATGAQAGKAGKALEHSLLATDKSRPRAIRIEVAKARAPDVTIKVAVLSGSR